MSERDPGFWLSSRQAFARFASPPGCRFAHPGYNYVPETPGSPCGGRRGVPRLRLNCDRRNLDLHIPRQAGDLDSGTGRRRRLEECAVNFVHLTKLVHVLEEDGRGHDMI